MENQEEKDGSVIRMLCILRNITLAMKVVPFAYVSLYIIGMLVYLFGSEQASEVVDLLFYVSPLTCLFFFGCSYILRFCNWYRSQTLFPLVTQVSVIVDNYIYEFGEYSIVSSATLVCLLFTATLVNTYFVFLRNKK